MCIRDSGQAAKELPNMGDVGASAWTRDEDIIQVDKDEWKTSKHSVHQPLERLRRIFEAKRHPDKLEESKWRYYGGLLDMIFLHWDLMIPAYQINHGEDRSSGCDGAKGLDVWDWVPVIFGNGIEAPVVSTRTPSTIRLWHDV